MWKNNMACFHANYNLFGMFLVTFPTPPLKAHTVFFLTSKKKVDEHFPGVFQGGLIWFLVTIVALPKVPSTWICGLRDPAPLNRSTRTQKP